ncbi:MAG: DUF6498-containing protein [Planctomycetota bacterium]
MTNNDPMRSGYDDMPPLGMSRTAWRTLLVVFANVFVLVGVLALGWSLRDVLLVYWAETVVIGVLCMAQWLLLHGIKALPIVAFFTVHFGIFSFVHLMFLIVLTSGVFTGGGDPFDDIPTVSPWWAGGLALLAVPHVFAAVRRVRANWNDPPPLMAGKNKMSDTADGMPYGRVVVMHITIIGGAFIALLLESPIGLLVLLVVLKTGFDLIVERRAQKKTHA